MNKDKVVILCGGRGRRLGKLSRALPKPLIPLGEKPILQHIVEFYMSHGFREFILCTGYLSESIEAFISRGNLGAKIEISNAGEDAGMLKRLFLVKDLIGNRAIVTYGDTFVNMDPNLVLKWHIKSRKNLTITIADIRSPFGIVKYDREQRVTLFEEKPLFSYYIGNFITDKAVLEDLDNNLISLPDGEGLIGLFNNLIDKGELTAYKHKGFNITFNTAQEWAKAEEDFIKFFTQEEG
ncbi:MAG: nucleotidyltransferase family protein [Candidatus Omnitrophica bacterium]|nr:nucleotidyltransferase family protein [Candidatus Omnitrophota bacterium]